MAVDLKKVEVTQRTWILLAILGLAVASYFFLGPADSSPTAAPVAVGIPANKTVAEVAPAQVHAVAVQPVATASMRDPFQVPAAYRQPDPTNMTETVNAHASAADKDKIAQHTVKSTPMPVPQLQGIVIGGSTSAAILVLGSESRPVRVGDMIGNYRLVTVEADSAVLAGPSGLITLWIRR